MLRRPSGRCVCTGKCGALGIFDGSHLDTFDFVLRCVACRHAKAKTKPFGLCSYCDARGCANFNDPKAGKDKCSVFGGCACKPGALADEVRFVDLCRAYLKTTSSKHQSPPYLKGMALRSKIWNHTMDVAQSTFAFSSSSPRPHSPPSVVTNLSNPTTGVRVGRENRLRKVGQFRTMAAQFLAQDDVEEAAALNRMADDLEQLDDPEDDAPCHHEPDVDECLGAFNKLAVVHRFDSSDYDGADFDGAEGLLPETGSLNSIQGASKRSDHHEDDIDRFIDKTNADVESKKISSQEWAEHITHAFAMRRAASRVPSYGVGDLVTDLAGAYVQSAITPISIELPAGYEVTPIFTKLVYTEPYGDFDLNDSDGSDDESPPKFQRFDLNASDASDEELLEAPSVGRLSMHLGSSSSIHPDDDFTSQEHDSWLRHLRQEHGTYEGFTSDDFKVWRLAQRRALQRALDDQDEKPDELPASLPLARAIPLPLAVVEHADMRFLFAVTTSLVKTGIAPTGHVGIVFEVSVVLKDRVRVTLQAEAARWRRTTMRRTVGWALRCAEGRLIQRGGRLKDRHAGGEGRHRRALVRSGCW